VSSGAFVMPAQCRFLARRQGG